MPQGAVASSASLRAISIPFRAPSNRERGLLIVPVWARQFFHEGYKVPFELRTPAHEPGPAWLTSASPPPPLGTNAGNYLVGKLRGVYQANRWVPNSGMWANLERRDDHIFMTVTTRPRFYHQQ